MVRDRIELSTFRGTGPANSTPIRRSHHVLRVFHASRVSYALQRSPDIDGHVRLARQRADVASVLADHVQSAAISTNGTAEDLIPPRLATLTTPVGVKVVAVP